MAEDKMKNLHMKFTEKQTLWGEFTSVFKTDQGSKWFFEYMLSRLAEEKERDLQEKRLLQEQKIKEEMLKNPPSDNLKNFDKIKTKVDSDDSDGEPLRQSK